MTDPAELVWRPPIYSTARLDALVCPLLVPRATLQARLPHAATLTLTPFSDVPDGLHPVVLEVWRVQDGSIEFAGQPLHQWWEMAGTAAGLWLGAIAGATIAATTGSPQAAANAAAAAAQWSGAAARLTSERNSRMIGTYNEILVTVPCALSAGGMPQDVSYVLRACTDSIFSLGGERIFGWGYQKSHARGHLSSTGTLEVETRPGKLVRLTVDATGAGPMNSSGIESFFQRPLLGLRPPGLPMLSYLDRAFAHPSVRMSPVHVRVEGAETLDEGLHGGSEKVPPSGPETSWGAFVVTGLPVTLTYPRVLPA